MAGMMSQRRLTLTLAAALGGAVLLSWPASADQRAVRGECGETRALRSNPHLDIRRAAHGHTVDGRLKHTVLMCGRIKPRQSNTRPLILISTRGGPRSRPQFIIIRTRIFRVRPNGRIGRRVGANWITEHSRAWVYKFRPQAIGNPRRYGWAVATAHRDAEDLLPKRRYRYHRLRAVEPEPDG